MFRSVARAVALPSIAMLALAGCTAKSDTSTTTTPSGAANAKAGQGAKSSARASVSTLGTSGDPAAPTAFCDAAKAFLDQQKVVLLLTKDQRAEIEPIILANIDAMQSKAPAGDRSSFDTYLNAWREYLGEPVGQSGRKIPPFDATLNTVRGQWKAAIDRDCGTAAATKSASSAAASPDTKDGSTSVTDSSAQ